MSIVTTRMTAMTITKAGAVARLAMSVGMAYLAGAVSVSSRPFQLHDLFSGAAVAAGGLPALLVAKAYLSDSWARAHGAGTQSQYAEGQAALDAQNEAALKRVVASDVLPQVFAKLDSVAAGLSASHSATTSAVLGSALTVLAGAMGEAAKSPTLVGIPVAGNAAVAPSRGTDPTWDTDLNKTRQMASTDMAAPPSALLSVAAPPPDAVQPAIESTPPPTPAPPTQGILGAIVGKVQDVLHLPVSGSDVPPSPPAPVPPVVPTGVAVPTADAVSVGADGAGEPPPTFDDGDDDDAPSSGGASPAVEFPVLAPPMSGKAEVTS